MEITDELLDKVADLCKLSFEGEAKGALKKDFQRMLNFVETINTVNTEGVNPLIHISTAVNILREDVVQEALSHNAVLENAPARDENAFLVPKVVKK